MNLLKFNYISNYALTWNFQGKREIDKPKNTLSLGLEGDREDL